MPNATEHALDEIIDKLQETLDHARGLPDWVATVIVIVTLVCSIVLLHALAFMITGPCIWAMYSKRKRLEHDRLLNEDETTDTDTIEMTHTPESVNGQ